MQELLDHDDKTLTIANVIGKEALPVMIRITNIKEATRITEDQLQALFKFVSLQEAVVDPSKASLEHLIENYFKILFPSEGQQHRHRLW